MATTNTPTTMAGLFKQVYGDDVINLLPDSTKLTKAISFKHAESLGDKFNQPVEVAAEHGITYAAAGEDPTLEAPTAGESKNAQVEGAQIFARARMTYEVLAKASAAGAKAFQTATANVVRRVVKAAGKRLEASVLHGRRGWGAISSVGAVDATHRTWVITDATWAAGLWAGSKGMKLDVFAANYTGSKINSNAAVEITAVNIGTKTLSVSGNATDLTNILAGMHLFPRTASPTTEMAGIDAIVRNTGSLFGLDASVYEVWAGHVLTSTGAITMEKLLDGVRRCVEMGLEDEAVAIVSPKAFQKLNSDLSALREFDSSWKKTDGENGVEEISYYGQNGRLKVMPHLYQKDGQIHIIAPKEWRRIGAKDLGFITPSGPDERLLFDVADSGSKELRCYFNGAVFCEAPAHAAVLDGITYA